MKKLFMICVLTVGLGGCGGMSPTATVDNSIVAVERSFTLSMEIASLYTNLPRCGSLGATQICSDPNLVLKIRTLAIRAHNAILEAKQNAALISVAIELVNEFQNLVPKS